MRHKGQEAITDLRDLLRHQDRNVRKVAAQTMNQVLQQMGRKAIPDLLEMLMHQDWDVRQATVHTLENLVEEDDLVLLTERAAREALTAPGDEIWGLLAHLDRKLYCPFPISAELEK
jgi:hypothetical protein